ncbi:MAG: tetratricopeptide repeat protein, partial [Bacteroidota bacterium]|nr:tetratricopeptide repeat protein [Bacteroidota bacterium]
MARDSVIYYYKRSLDDSLSHVHQKEAINKALFFGKNLKTDTLTFNLLYQKCRITYALGEYDSLLIQDKMLLGQASLFKDFLTIARQHYLMGLYFEGVALVPDSAFIRYNLSKSYYLESKDSSWVGRNLLIMGTIQKDQNDFFGSKVTLAEALPYLRNPKERNYMAQCLNLLATDHRKLFNYPDAFQYYTEAISTTNNYIDKLIFKNNLAVTYTDNSQFDKAIALLLPIVDDAVLKQNPIQYARVLDNLAYVQWLSGKQNSEEPFLDALKIRKTEKDSRGLIASYTHLGEFHSQDNPQVAKAYLDTVIKLSKAIKMPRAEVDALKFWMPLEPTNVQIRNRRIFLQDSLHRAETNVKTQFAKYKYDNQVSQDKNLHLEKENAERVLEVTRQRNQKIIAFLGVALLLTGIGFLYYFFQ